MIADQLAVPIQPEQWRAQVAQCWMIGHLASTVPAAAMVRLAEAADYAAEGRLPAEVVLATQAARADDLAILRAVRAFQRAVDTILVDRAIRTPARAPLRVVEPLAGAA